MTKLNDPNSSIRLGNTGLPSAIMVPKTIAGGFLLPKALALTAAEVATSAAFFTKMQALTLNPKETRVYPIGPFTDIADKSEEDVYVKSNYGVSTFVREGKVGWQFAMTSGGIGLQNILRRFNQTKSHTFIYYDSENTVFGVDDGLGGMKGCEIEDFSAKPWKVSDGTKPAIFLTEILFANTRELNDESVFLKCDSTIHASIKGLIDLDIVKVSSSSTHAFVKVVTKLGRVNLYSLYKTALAAAAVWYADDAGVEKTISTVTANDATEDFDLALTVASTTRLQLETPAILDAANIGGPPDNGYESNAIDITTGAEVDATR